MTMEFKHGEIINATYEGRTVRAMVYLNAAGALVIMWDTGVLSGHAGVMPILRDEGGAYVSLMEGLPVTLARADGSPQR
jgi:hypothetical protein